MPEDALDPAALLAAIPSLLPSSRGSSPLPHPTDAVAAIVHAIHVALGFRLEGGSASDRPAEEAEASAERDIDDTASETTTAVDPDEQDGGSVGQQVLNQEWNSRGEDAYAFAYRHEQSAMVFRVRVGRMGGRVQVDGMAEVSLCSKFCRPNGRTRWRRDQCSLGDRWNGVATGFVHFGICYD